VIARAIQQHERPAALLRRWRDVAFLALLNVLERRVSVGRRFRHYVRGVRSAIDQKFAHAGVRATALTWTLIAVVAAAFRFYRPMVTANLGYSDTYVHLYLVKLLQDGRQVDPAWGPYPRGMHFLLLALKQLTNVDEILLLNFFGAFVGVLITLAVADAARRISGSIIAAAVSGLLFATYIGSAGQYFALGGAFDTQQATAAMPLTRLAYASVPPSLGEFDIALSAFQRQTTTLSQELAIVFLFPAVLFLLDYFRTRSRWHLAGFGGCSAAIAAVHSGVLIPLVVLCAIATVAALVEKVLSLAKFRQATVIGAVAVLIGSLWAVAFIAYPYAGGDGTASVQRNVGRTAMFYFPLLRSVLQFENDSAPAEMVVPHTVVAFTPFLIAVAVLAVGLIVASFLISGRRRGGYFWIGACTLVLLLFHFASTFDLPVLVETRRNSEWLIMSIAALVGVSLAAIITWSENVRVRSVIALPATALAIFWLVNVPSLGSATLRDRIVNYSGYGATVRAVLDIERRLEPFSWTLVSYGQEFPMVLKRGFHIPAAEFLERYDPAAEALAIPTPNVYIVVEKIPHHFEVNDWAARFSRTDVEERLQTWCALYRLSHQNMSLKYDDEHVRVYAVERSAAEMKKVIGAGDSR
jgi:hypothetical protein